MFKCSPHYGPSNTVLLVERLERWKRTATNKSKNWMIVYLVNPIKLTWYVHIPTNTTLPHVSIFNPRKKNTCFIPFEPKEKGLNTRIEDEAYPGLERMHCQKSLKGPGTVLNGFPSKQAYKFYKTTMCEIQDVKNFTTKNQKKKLQQRSLNC